MAIWGRLVPPLPKEADRQGLGCSRVRQTSLLESLGGGIESG